MKRIWTTLFLTAVVLAAVLTPLSADAYALNDRNKPLSREILTEGMVLLKNEADALPLAGTDGSRFSARLASIRAKRQAAFRSEAAARASLRRAIRRSIC